MSNQQSKEQLEAIVGGNPVSVIYQPNLSPVAVKPPTSGGGYKATYTVVRSS